MTEQAPTIYRYEVPVDDRWHALEGRCAGPGCGRLLTDQSASAYWCSPDCQEVWTRRQTGRPSLGSAPVRGSEEVDPSHMRWRPDLVAAFDDSDLTLTQEVAVRGLNRCWYARTDGRRFLRLDDGHRFVGAQAPEDGPPDGLWDRLERELGDRRRLDPDSVVAPGTYTARGTLPPQITGVGRVLWVALRAVCTDEAMYQRAVAFIGGPAGITARQMTAHVAAGRYTEHGWSNPERVHRRAGTTAEAEHMLWLGAQLGSIGTGE